MKQRPLGLTGLRVSELGFGTWQLGGQGWGCVDARTLEKAVGRALDLGVNLFDTAGVYGFGRSEGLLSRFLGSALRSVIVVSKA